jgi:hypothetical protein
LWDGIHNCVVDSLDVYDDGAYSSKSNLQQYTQSAVRPRASCMRFLWSV